MKKNSLLLLLLLVQLLVYGRDNGPTGLDNQPLSFRENRGQIRDQQGKPRTDIDFILQASGMTLYVGKGQLHYQFIKEEEPDATEYTPENSPQHYQVAGHVTLSRIDVQLKGANPTAVLVKEAAQAAKYHYYTDGSQHGVTDVQTYGKITYKNIYPSIDWVLYTKGTQLKYDFIVHPGGKVGDIQMNYTGAQTLELQKDGSLKVSGPIGSITEAAPYIYEQESKKAVTGKFILNQNTLSYETAPHQGTLVVDPGVDWATYYGGEGADGSANSIATDAGGNVYITGKAKSLLQIATTGAHQTSYSGAAGSDSYLAKFDSLGQLQWATYYGGTATSGFYITTDAIGVATDPFGHVYITGSTSAESGIATPGSFQPTRATNAFQQGFLAQFDSEGIRQWGTYYGASLGPGPITQNATFIYGIACDKLGNVYIGGQTDSASASTGTLVTAGAHQATPGGGNNPDGLLVKFDSSGNREWATYYGGEKLDKVTGVACDDDNNVYITGTTFNSTTGIASPGSWIDTDNPDVDGYVAKFNSDGVRQWGTYLHASGLALATNSYNQLYVAGYVQSAGSDTMVYTPGCHQSTLILGSQFNGFLMQMNPEDGTRNWGTYYGADKPTYARSVACDGQGNVFLSGDTKSYATLTTETIATEGSYQDTLGSPAGLGNPPKDAFLALFDSTGQRKWATYYGGAGDDDGFITCDSSGVVYMTGATKSTVAIATSDGYQTTYGGVSDAFLVRWLPVDIALASVLSPAKDTVCSGEVPFEVVVRNQGRMDLEDTLKISYSYTGPDAGSAEFFFTNDLAAGAQENFDLGMLDLPFPGDYELTVYLHYTRNDNDRLNDTIHVTLTATNAEPVAAIEVNQVGTVYHFTNPSALPSDSYLWDFGDGETSTEANPSHQYEATATYEVTLVMTGFCGSDTATQMLEAIGDGSGINDPALTARLSIYPNPAKQMLYLKADELLRLDNYSIVNVLGQEVLGGELKGQTSINVSALAAGSYFIRIQTNEGIVNKQFQMVGQ